MAEDVQDHVVTVAAETPGAHALRAFDDIPKGARAPAWLSDAVVSRWNLPAQAEMALITVSENASFVVRIGGTGEMVVRVQRPGYGDNATSIESELLWIEGLRTDVDLATPAPVRLGDGSLVASIRDDDGALWLAVAFKFVSGRILEDVTDPIPYFSEIGSTTALMHEHSRRWVPPTSFARFSWELGDMVGATPRWGQWRNSALSEPERRVMARAEAAALNVIRAAPKSPQSWGLIHADLRPSNIMLEGSQLTMIDFDDCGYSWMLYDFASALTFYEHLPVASEMAAEWLSGYEAEGTLTKSELELAGALSMIRRLTMLGWTTTHRSDALPSDLWNAMAPGSAHVAENYLRNPLWLSGQH